MFRDADVIAGIGLRVLLTERLGRDAPYVAIAETAAQHGAADRRCVDAVHTVHAFNARGSVRRQRGRVAARCGRTDGAAACDPSSLPLQTSAFDRHTRQMRHAAVQTPARHVRLRCRGVERFARHRQPQRQSAARPSHRSRAER